MTQPATNPIPQYHPNPVIAELYERMCVDIMNHGFLHVMNTIDHQKLNELGLVDLSNDFRRCQGVISTIQCTIGLE